MKLLYKVFTMIMFVAACSNAYSLNDSVTNTITNFEITGGGTKFSFDIYTLRTTPVPIQMGSSTFVIRFNAGTMNSPVLSNINPKYTVGSPSGSYSAMITTMLFANNVAAQINYTGGPGDIISGDPGPFGIGERIATVTLNILLPVAITLQWNVLDTYVTGTDLGTLVGNRFVGIYIGTLPVELSSFSFNTTRNNVALNWVTSNEINNSGFDVERRPAMDNSDWNKIGFVNGSGNSHENKSYNFKDNGLEIGKYYYRLKQIDFNGNFEYFELEGEVIVGVPAQFEMSQNYPNPFNPATKINFSLPADSKVTLNVFDLSGRLVSNLINNEFKTANYYTVSFNGADLSSGVYFYSINAEKFRETKKMLLIK